MKPPVVRQILLRVSDGAGEGSVEHDFDGPVIQVGRGPGNDLVFADPRVSSIHGRIVLDGSVVRYQDMGSTNGSALIREGEKQALGRGESPGVELSEGDQIQLGDADRPSSINLMKLLFGPLRATDATVVAQRALGEISGLPTGEAFHRLLQLLARLRTESDSFALTRQVLEFCVQVLGGVSRADCFMLDSTGRFGPVLAVGPDHEGVAVGPPSATLIDRLVRSREALLLEDLQAVPDSSASMRTMPARSLLLAPLVADDRVIGAIQVGSVEDGRFEARDLDLVSVLAQQLSAVLSGSRLIQRLRKAEESLRGQCDYLKQRLGQRPALEEMVGRSPAMQQLRGHIEKVAPSRTFVLIQGETGVGKELVARALHENSPRASAAFAAVNCSALASGLLESELFGHVRGAFTGAHRDRKGLFEVADRGTLFLDEVGDMPAELQPKLLRVLEEGLVTPVGSSKPVPVDVRVVCATHRDLEAEVAAGRFRQDLLFRMNVFSLTVPPLRQRTGDILPIARLFLRVFSAEHGKTHLDIGPEAAAALQGYDWPGNVRELKNEIERATLLAPDGAPIERGHLSERLGAGEEFSLNVDGTLKDVLQRLEATVLKCALQRHKGNRTRCAKALGISRQALIAKIARLEVEEDS